MFEKLKMGQSSSQPISGNGTPSRRRSLRSPFMRHKKNRTPLSATFAAPTGTNCEALNINTATVEQLMTLPGISRRIAQGIVDHRNAIGGRFQKIDDLALVSGIGAEKLDKIRSEICVKRKNGSIHGSSVSSRTPSLDSILSEPIIRDQKTILNINTASVFQLQQINGMNQEIAAKVIDYRNKKGPFKSLDDLIKVKGLSHARLGAIRMYLSVTDDDISKTPRLRHASTFSASTPIKNGYTKYTGHRKSLSVPIKMNMNLTNGFTNVPVNDIFDLLGAYSHRPTIEEDFRYERDGQRALRLASWNLDRMCREKSENPGVLEVICRTILENKLSIICVQEVVDPIALRKICDELNQPSLKRVLEWRENTKNWKYLVNTSCVDGLLNGLGFIYDANNCRFVQQHSREIDLRACLDKNIIIPPSAYLAAFELEDWTCYVLNLYLRYYNLTNTTTILKRIESELEKTKLPDTNKPTIEDVFFVAGDFTGIKFLENTLQHGGSLSGSGHKEDKIEWQLEFNASVDLQNLGYFNALELNSTSFEFGTQAALNNNAVKSSCNILCKEKLPVKRSAFREAIYRTKSPLTIYDKELLLKVPSKSDILTGYANIIRQGLCHMAIPRGWMWGGPASEHCPIWIEIYQRINKINNNNNKPPLGRKLSLNADTKSISSQATLNKSKDSLLSRRSTSALLNPELKSQQTPDTTIQQNGAVAVLTNGDLNSSCDSVFLKNDK